MQGSEDESVAFACRDDPNTINQTLEHYRKLHEVAEKLGCWPEQRQHALARVETWVQRSAQDSARFKQMPAAPDCSLRVEIALWENDLDAAWQLIQNTNCRRELLLDLAGRLEKQRPRDAGSLYRRIIPTFVEETNNRAYATAVSYLVTLSRLMKASGEAAEFADYLSTLRGHYKAKRNFVKLLDSRIGSK